MEKVSTLALEQEWSSIDVSDCTAWVYSDMGHDFIIFNFDAADVSYVYDPSMKLWHQRATRNPLKDTLHRWEINYCIQRNGNVIVGDRHSTNIYRLSNDYTTDNGTTILRVRTTAHQHAQQMPFIVDAVRFDMQTGTGITNEDPARFTQAPTIMFRYSYSKGDGGWSAERRQTFGQTGNYIRTVEYTKLGSSRNFVYEFKISDPCRTAILNGWVDMRLNNRGRKDG
jgi:hypothetical protein